MNEHELHVLMGPNGSGKSTLAYALMGHPRYQVKARELMFAGKDIRKKRTDERARLGLFLGFQYPQPLPGISLSSILPAALKKQTSSRKQPDTIKYFSLASREAFEKQQELRALHTSVLEHMQKLGLNETMLYRNLNEDFSGGEKKKAEMIQMLALSPKLALLDEPDSGLDVDALRSIAESINTARNNGTSVLLITHYQRILKYLKPDRVHILAGGMIVRSGGVELAKQIEQHGYAKLTITDEKKRTPKKIAR